MLVTGSVDIERDGSVGGHAFDKAEALPKGVVDMIDGAMKTWRFEPVTADGHAIAARSSFSLRVVGKQLDDGNYALRIAGVRFGKGDDDTIPRRRGRLAPPRYPEDAVRNGVGGTVYLVLRIGRDGNVEDVIAQQVNLRVAATPQGNGALPRAVRGYQRRRRHAGGASIHRRRPRAADASSWSVQVPVDFFLPERPPTVYGRWEAYVPGPRVPVPWRTDAEGAHGSADAVAAGGVYSDSDNGPRLLTPPGRG